MVNRLAGQVWMQGEDLEAMEIQVVFGDGENGQIITNIELINWMRYIRKKKQYWCQGFWPEQVEEWSCLLLRCVIFVKENVLCVYVSIYI